MNPRDAAHAKRFIDSVIRFTKTKLLPHVPEMTMRFAHSAESGIFPMRVPQINFHCLNVGEANRGGFGRYNPGKYLSQRRDGIQSRGQKKCQLRPGNSYFSRAFCAVRTTLGQHRHRIDPRGVPFKGAQGLASCQIPQPHSRIPGAGAGAVAVC